ncbi:MAG: response regulator transcription factor [bacterium]
MPIRILLVDDNKQMREELRGLLERESDVEAVCEAASGETAVETALALSPDLILMDISMPDLNGIEATKRILAKSPDQRIVVLSLLKDIRFAESALRAGAKGYVLKNRAFHELTLAIRTVVSGGTYLSPDIPINFD